MDNLLNGGIYSNQILEITGCSGSGKTHLCYKILAHSIKNKKDNFIFLDSGQTFDLSKLLKFVLEI